MPIHLLSTAYTVHCPRTNSPSISSTKYATSEKSVNTEWRTISQGKANNGVISSCTNIYHDVSGWYCVNKPMCFCQAATGSACSSNRRWSGPQNMSTMTRQRSCNGSIHRPRSTCSCRSPETHATPSSNHKFTNSTETKCPCRLLKTRRNTCAFTVIIAKAEVIGSQAGLLTSLYKVSGLTAIV